MKFVKFSTKNADYHLNLARHYNPSSVSDLEDFDAIVLETGVMKYETCSLREMKRNVQYGNTINANLELDQPRPIFYVDIPIKESLSWVNPFTYMPIGYDIDFAVGYFFLPIMSIAKPPLTYPLLLPLLTRVPSLFSGRNEKMDKAISYLSLFRFFMRHGLNTAVPAKKIEKFIVPEIQKRKSIDTPNIFMEFGSGHSDIEIYLKQKPIRDFVAGFHSILKLNVCDMSYVDKVQELRHKDSEEPSSSANVLSVSEEESFQDWERLLYRV